MTAQSPLDTLKSKKFIAYMVAELTWKVLAGLIVFKHTNGTALILLLTLFLVAGFVEAGYILGQSSLDRYLRLAQIAAEAGHDLMMKDFSMSAKGMQEKRNSNPAPAPAPAPLNPVGTTTVPEPSTSEKPTV